MKGELISQKAVSSELESKIHVMEEKIIIQDEKLAKMAKAVKHNNEDGQSEVPAKKATFRRFKRSVGSANNTKTIHNEGCKQWENLGEKFFRWGGRLSANLKW